ncbi:MAG TPA: hypothetical protein VJT73_09370 [Polyangiaceae bacterium]|nr:hypothetical protein [Polyangiaceae bacterium]
MSATGPSLADYLAGPRALQMGALPHYVEGPGTHGTEAKATPVPNVASSSDHARARAILLVAFRQVMKREPTTVEIQGIQAVALHETGYGKLGRFPGSHNWGSVQIPGTWGATECPAGGLLWQDSHPRPDGTDVVQSVCFRSYPDDVAGATDLVRNLTKARPKTLAALGTGDADQIAAAMYAEHYYEGHGKTAADRVAGYAKGIARRAAEIAPSLGEPLAVLRLPPPAGDREALRTLDGGRSILPLEAHRTRDRSRSILPLAALFGAFALAGDELDPAPPLATVAPRGRALFAEETEGLGDLLPTIVTADDARRYVNETEAEFERLDRTIQTSSVNDSFKQSWAIDRDAWRKFREDALRNAGLFNAKATMEQTDRWKKKVSDWNDSFTKEGGRTVGPAPAPPAQGLPPPPSASAGWIQLAMMIAALFALGYVVRGFRGAA